jgi:UDP-GlcNAc:undecaprenyl-phosphate GlcNAc-1-phosphate transferase
MTSFETSALIAFCISCTAMPIAVVVSWRLGAISETGGRHVGAYPVGRFGGAGALLGTLCAIIVQIRFNPSIRHAFQDLQRQAVGLTIGLVLVATVGFWDDIKRLPAVIKLLVQIIAAIIAYCFGLQISVVDLPLLEPIQLGILSLPATVLWIVGIVNAVNLIDGLDGLAGGVLLFACLVNAIVAVSLGAILPAVLMMSLAGGILGFLLYNWHPAKIYLGDGGAYSIGFILSVTGLLAPVQKASTSISLLVPLLSLGLPVFDTILTLIRRLVSSRKIFAPDRSHIHHLLLDSGIGYRRVVIGLYLVCCVFCSVALALVMNRNRILGSFLIGSSVIAIFIWGVGVKEQLKQSMVSFGKMFSQSVSNRFGKK